MPLRLEPVTTENRPAFDRLLQYYLHDLSEFTEIEPGEQGLFDPCQCPTLTDGPRNRLFLITLKNKPAGLAIVDRAERGNCIQDFFVLRCYRRIGLGEDAANMLFDTYPGAWEVTVHNENEVGVTFWRSVVKHRVGKASRELQSGTGAMVVFEFRV
ncbi:MAG: hypothetical protein JSS66_02195 [Armatimonadetes bacterium]|nr:hypothetical protein [Armatimonadota bacterium]